GRAGTPWSVTFPLPGTLQRSTEDRCQELERDSCFASRPAQLRSHWSRAALVRMMLQTRATAFARAAQLQLRRERSRRFTIPRPIHPARKGRRRGAASPFLRQRATACPDTSAIHSAASVATSTTADAQTG